MNLAKGKNIGESLLNSAQAHVPGGPAAQAAFDAAPALAKGKNIQKAALSSAGSAILNKIEQPAGPILSRARAVSIKSPRSSTRACVFGKKNY